MSVFIIVKITFFFDTLGLKTDDFLYLEENIR